MFCCNGYGHSYCKAPQTESKSMQSFVTTSKGGDVKSSSHQSHTSLLSNTLGKTLMQLNKNEKIKFHKLKKGNKTFTAMDC